MLDIRPSEFRSIFESDAWMRRRKSGKTRGQQQERPDLLHQPIAVFGASHLAGLLFALLALKDRR